jgi:hypothetical protein
MGLKSPAFRKYVLYLFSFKTRVKLAAERPVTSCGIFLRLRTKVRPIKTRAYIAKFHGQKNSGEPSLRTVGLEW